MKKILLIATGGTIASEEHGEGLTPAIDAKQMISYIPEIESVCTLEGISIMSVDSTNMNPALMVQMAEAVRNHYEEYDGFVIAHGTDTMAYSAAALSYMFHNLGKPVVLTGSQIALEVWYTDAKKNLSDAVHFACEDIQGVFIAFDGVIIRGTRAMKLKTRSTDAFKSVNFPPVAQVGLGRITYDQGAAGGGYGELFKLGTNGDFSVCGKLNPNILVVKMFPGIGTEIFDFIKRTYDGVILESFGIGGIPGQDNDIAACVHELVEAGVAVVITTQCLYEGIDLDIYAVGQKLAKEKVILAGDMTTEALTMKLMWALGSFDAVDDVKKFMETPYMGDRSY